MQTCSLSSASLKETSPHSIQFITADGQILFESGSYYRISFLDGTKEDLVVRLRRATAAEAAQLTHSSAPPASSTPVTIEEVKVTTPRCVYVCGAARESNLTGSIATRAAMLRCTCQHLQSKAAASHSPLIECHGQRWARAELRVPSSLKGLLPNDEAVEVVYEAETPADFIAIQNLPAAIPATMCVAGADLCLNHYEILLIPPKKNVTGQIEHLEMLLHCPSVWIGICSHASNLLDRVRECAHSAFEERPVLFRAFTQLEFESSRDSSFLQRELDRCLEQAKQTTLVLLLALPEAAGGERKAVQQQVSVDLDPDGKVKRISPSSFPHKRRDSEDANHEDEKSKWKGYLDGTDCRPSEVEAKQSTATVMSRWLKKWDTIRESIPDLKVCVQVPNRDAFPQADFCLVDRESSPSDELSPARLNAASKLLGGGLDNLRSYTKTLEVAQASIPEYFRADLMPTPAESDSASFIESIFQSSSHRTAVLYVKGAPGSGKTRVLRSIASEAYALGIVPLWLRLATYLCAEVGGLQRRLEELFRVASSHSRSLIFIDDWETFFVGEDSKYIDEGRKMFKFLCDGGSSTIGVVCSGVCEREALISDLAGLITKEIAVEEWAAHS